MSIINIFLAILANLQLVILHDPMRTIEELFKNASDWNHPGKFQEYPYSKGELSDTYDFIIIGSGAGGSTVANRLSEIDFFNILLLEVGQTENFFTDIPAFCALPQLTPLNEGYMMEYQEGACMGMINKQCSWPRGRALGGTSVINYMIYTRGNIYDYNRWSSYVKDPQWSYNTVLNYYKKSEDSHLEFYDEGYHSTGGYLGVTNVPYRSKIVEAFLQSGRETGRRIVDYNGHDHFGFGYVQANLRQGRRCSAAKSFIYPAARRPNLSILLGAQVTKILIDENQTAYGVEYETGGVTYRVYASKEVILSAGPIASPQLLMVSGVGPASHLKEFGIPLVKDLPVGQFLQDHLTFIGLTFLIEKPYSLVVPRALNLKNTIDYLFFGKGQFTSLGGVEALGYIKTKLANYSIEYPDIELIFLGGSITADGGTFIREGFRMNQHIYNKVYEPINFKDCWSVIPMLLHPKSYGYIRLQSPSIKVHPKLYGRYYTDPKNHDARTMVEAVKEVVRLSKTSAFQSMGTRINEIPLPGCEQLIFASDEYWECAVRLLTPSLHHQVGTCKMGSVHDPTAVVDTRLRVKGINRLRVIDSSIIPFALSAHTNAPAFMIGEQGADFLKHDWVSSNGF